MSHDLFNLLPAVYRIRDAQIAAAQPLLTADEKIALAALQALEAAEPLSADQQAELDLLTSKDSRGPLESLLLVIGEQLGILADDLDQLYDNEFIETCAPWVIPYIGDLIGYQAVNGIAPSIDNPRAEVAETLSLRRRKGTILVMEQLARDATAWGAHAVEFFKVLGDTQYMNHLRLLNHYAPDLRRWQTGEYINRGFDRTAHRVDVRRIRSRRGRYNIENIGVFLWSTNAYSVTNAPAASTSDPQCFRFNPLNMDMPLFHRGLSQGEEIVAAAQPVNVPDRLRRRPLCADLLNGVGAAYYGEGHSLALQLDGQFVNPYQIKVADLAGTEGNWANRPGADQSFAAVIDPELGRIAVPDPQPGSAIPSVRVSYYLGFNGDLGGGEYARADTFIVDDPAWIFPFPDTAGAPRYTDLPGAVSYAISMLAENGQAAVEITRSETYPSTGTKLALNVNLPAGATLELRAAQGARPTLLLTGEISVCGATESTFAVNGLLVAASAGMVPANPTPAALVRVPEQRPDGTANQLQKLLITHSSLVPGWSVDPKGNPQQGAAPTLQVEPGGTSVAIANSILGAVRSTQLVTVMASASILDATDRTNVAYSALDNAGAGGSLSLDGCTVVGKVHATILELVSNSIFWGALQRGDTWTTALSADRKQEGCVRFSFLPIDARVPRHFECVEQTLAGPQPIFFSTRYGHPAYLKLLASTPDLIRRGADDGGEMGAFHFVLAPMRESDLEIRLQEFLPVGLEFGLIYQN